MITSGLAAIGAEAGAEVLADGPQPASQAELRTSAAARTLKPGDFEIRMLLPVAAFVGIWFTHTRLASSRTQQPEVLNRSNQTQRSAYRMQSPPTYEQSAGFGRSKISSTRKKRFIRRHDANKREWNYKPD